MALGLTRRLQEMRHWLGNLRRWPGHKRYCPLCRSYLAGFKPFGIVPRPEARCPRCGSLERHRLVWLFMQARTNLFDGAPKRMLHVAPESAFSVALARVQGLDRITADLSHQSAMIRMDLSDIPLPDKRFDIIYCSHVLEHIPDDRKAMRELYRVLRTGGWAILQVPVLRDTTFEDPSVTSPADRLRLFGQEDHVRVYGRDYRDRLTDARFHVVVEDFGATFPPAKRRYFGLMEGEAVYFCRKLPPTQPIA
jgi:SAM-dependent methyltransferase